MKEEEKAAEMTAIIYELKLDIPETFQEAWNHPDPVIHERWRKAIRREFHCMNEKKTWRKIRQNDMLPGRICIKCK